MSKRQGWSIMKGLNLYITKELTKQPKSRWDKPSSIMKTPETWGV